MGIVMKVLGYIGTLSAVILLAACGGSSKGGSGSNGDGITDYCGDQIELIFPATYSATLSDQITVRGSAACDTIDSISINGVFASSTDNFANWQASVSLQPGRNTLSAEIQEGDETHNLDLAAIESNELFQAPDDMVVSSDGNTLYAMDPSRRQVVKIDTRSGARTLVSSGADASEPYPFGNMYDIALNEADNILYVASRYIVGMTSNNVGIIAVDLSDGSRTLVHNPDDLKGGESRFHGGSMVYDAERKRIYMSSPAEVFWIDLNPAGTPGKMTILSNNTTPDANNTWGRHANINLVLDSANDRLIVSDDQVGQILAISLLEESLGERSVLLSAFDEQNQLNAIGDIILKDANTLFISDDAYVNDEDVILVYEYNFTTNSLSSVFNSSDTTTERELHHNQSPKLVYSAAKSKLWASNYSARSIAEIDLSQGTYENVYYNLDSQVTGTTEVLKDLSRHALDVDNQHIYYEVKDNSIHKLDLATGQRSVFQSEIRPEGDSGDGTESMGYDSILKAVITSGDLNEDVSDTNYGNVVAWPVDGSDAYTITDSKMDTTSDLETPWDWVRLSNSEGIVVDDTSSPSRYYQTNIETGSRTEIEVDLSAVPDNLEAEDMEISADKTTLYVTEDSTFAGLYAIDLATKTARVITDSTTPDDGNEFRLVDPESLALSSDGEHVYVGDNSRAALVKINLESGSREPLIYDTNHSTNSWAERIQGISVDHERQLIYTSCDSEGVFLMMDEISNEWVLIAE